MPSPPQVGGGSPVEPELPVSEALTGPVLVPGSVALADVLPVAVPVALAEVGSVALAGVLCESLTDAEPSALSVALALALVVGVVPALPEPDPASVSALSLLPAEARSPSSPQPSAATNISPEKTTHDTRVVPTTRAGYHLDGAGGYTRNLCERAITTDADRSAVRS